MTRPDTPTPLAPGEQAGAISRLVVRTIAEYVGRGPKRARTSIGQDVVTVILDDTLTKAEQSLVRDGAADEVVAMRKAFQRTMAATFIEGVEGITGRRVSAFLSDNHIDPDCAAEVFILAPKDEKPDPAERAEPRGPGG